MIEISLSFHYFLCGVAWWLEFNITRQFRISVPFSCVSTVIIVIFVLLLLLQALSRSSYDSQPLLSNYSISIHFDFTEVQCQVL